MIINQTTLYGLKLPSFKVYFPIFHSLKRVQYYLEAFYIYYKQIHILLKLISEIVRASHPRPQHFLIPYSSKAMQF